MPFIFLFCNDLLFFHNEFYKQDAKQNDRERNCRQDLLTVNGRAEQGISVFLHSVENAATYHGSSKATKSADTEFDRGSLHEIFAINVIVRQIDQILACARAGNVIYDRIQNNEPPERRSGKNIDQISDSCNGHTELNALRIGALIRITRDRLGEACANETTRNIDDLHRSDRKQKILGLINSHESDRHINGHAPDHVNDNGVAESLVGKQHANDLPERLRFFRRLLFDLLIFHAHQADKVTDRENKHHRSDKDKSALDIAGFGKAVHCPSHGKADDNARDQRNDLFCSRKIRSSVRINIGVTPVKDHGGYKIISEIGDHQTANDNDHAKRLRNIEKRKQIQNEEAHLAYTVDRYRNQFDVPYMLYNENGAKLEQKRK